MITKEQLQRIVEISNIAIFYNKDGSEFQKALIAFAPEIEADIIGSALDHNCSCTKKIKDFINNKSIIDEMAYYYKYYILLNHLSLNDIHILAKQGKILK